MQKAPDKLLQAPIIEPPTRGSDQAHQSFDRLLIGLVILLLCLFATGTWFTPKSSVSTAEKRKLADCPKLHFKRPGEFTTGFEAFAADHMLFRNQLVSIRNYLKYQLFGVSGSSRVLAGKQGWLYYLGDGSAPIFRHEVLYGDQELKQWKLALEERSQWFAKRGIKYILVVAADKPSVYPEFLPPGFEPMQPQSRMDQLVNYLADDTKINFINLADTMRANKGAELLYYKTDSHWNDLGAYLGYRKIMECINKSGTEITPLEKSQLQLRSACNNAGDCAGMMGLLGWLPENAPTLPEAINVPGQYATAAYRSHGTATPRVLVLHDSFGEYLKPLFGKTFHDVSWHWETHNSFDANLVMAEKPDIVVQELAERRIAYTVPEFMNDYRQWLTETIKQSNAGNTFISILPCTADVNVPRLTSYEPLKALNIKPTTCRSWAARGDQVTFDPTQAGLIDWYLLKSQDQGAKLFDAKSQKAYQQLADFVRTSGRYAKAGEFKLYDGSTLTLFKRS